MGRPVRIVTDSTTDFTVDEGAALGVTIVPLLVRFGDEAFADRVEMAVDAFYARLETSRTLPTTSQPTPAAFEAAFRPLLDADADVLCITLSAKLSGTHNSAEVARSHLDQTRITVVDSEQASLATQTLVREAVRLARAGQSLADVAASVEALKPRVHIVATIDTLEYLRRNGRIGRAAAVVGGLVSLKVLITVQDGVVAPLERVRTRARALERVRQRISEAAPFYGPIMVGHSDDRPTAEALADALRREYPGHEIYISELGPVIGAHAGPGTVGAGFIVAEGEE